MLNLASGLAALLTLAAPAPPAPAADAAPKPLTVSAVRVSSTMPKFKSYTFDGDNLVDGRTDTSWQPRERGGTEQIGEWFELEMPRQMSVEALEIANGFQREDDLGDLFALNSRLLHVLVVGDSLPGIKLELDGKRRGFQTVRLPYPLITQRVRVIVLRSEVGSKWRQLAVSEVRLLGGPSPLDVATMAAPPPVDLTRVPCPSAAWRPLFDATMAAVDAGKGRDDDMRVGLRLEALSCGVNTSFELAPVDLSPGTKVAKVVYSLGWDDVVVTFARRGKTWVYLAEEDIPPPCAPHCSQGIEEEELEDAE